MQGQNNEGGNDSADLNFKSSDIQQGDEGQLFVNIEGAEERAAEEAEAKAKIEAEERAKREAEERARVAEENARQAAKRKAEKARLAKEKKLAKKEKKSNKKIVICACIIALIIVACIAMVFIFRGKSAEPEGAGVTMPEREIVYTTIADRYRNKELSESEALAEFDKYVEGATSVEDRVNRLVYEMNFFMNTVENMKISEQVLAKICSEEGDYAKMYCVDGRHNLDRRTSKE